MEDQKTCSQCKAKLEGGFLYITQSEQATNFMYTVWVKGAKEEYSKFLRAEEDAPQYPIRIYKCEKCHHLEFYAEAPQPWKY